VESWSTVSNAGVRLSRTRAAVSPRSTESRRSEKDADSSGLSGMTSSETRLSGW